MCRQWSSLAFQSFCVFLFFCVVEGRTQRSRGNTDSDSPWPKLEEGEYCQSQGEFKFDPVRPVKKANNAPRESTMSFCTQFKRNTCCNRTHTDVALLRDRQALLANFNPECRRITETVSCSHCHPQVGTKAVKGICEPLCEAWYHACQAEFFSSGLSKLTPCLDTSLLCSRLDDIVGRSHRGAAFCQKMGFDIARATDEDSICYDGSVPEGVGAPDPTEIKTAYTRYEEGFDYYDQKYSSYIFAVSWSILIIVAGHYLWNTYGPASHTEEDDFDDFCSPQKKDRPEKDSATRHIVTEQAQANPK
jgi:hypothetical protein